MSVKSNVKYFILPIGAKFRLHVESEHAVVDLIMSREHLKGMSREIDVALRKSKELKPARDALDASSPPKAGAGQRKRGARR